VNWPTNFQPFVAPLSGAGDNGPDAILRYASTVSGLFLPLARRNSERTFATLLSFFIVPNGPARDVATLERVGVKPQNVNSEKCIE
jgi:hypothetical protein